MTTVNNHFATLATADTSRWLLLALILVSFIVVAESLRTIELPDTYREPLADVIYDQQTAWRAEKMDENGWRTDQEELIPEGRIRSEVLPHYDYSSGPETDTSNLFQNANELARPKTNILRLNF